MLVPEEIDHQAQDLVVPTNPETLTIQSLALKPTPIESSLVRVSRAYRHPDEQSELVNETPPVARW